MCQHTYKLIGRVKDFPQQYRCTKCGDVCYHTSSQGAAEVRRQLGPTGRERTR